ncbi:sulfotransferase family protein [Nocardioides rubriscoriae]|uniref:sulfotransferase family protein n=1 Tax=Nocardioides rubriscoriae TaxID=642762 RepID=UPI0011DF32D2|nr:hypothetical protein [Nocardioides rubriscoriae]
MPQLVVITGSGRSGTSSAAGALKRLGYHVPQPEKQADEANPRGYYESSWVVTFHARWCRRLGVRAIDTRPEAGGIMMADLTEQREALLRRWLDGQLALRAPDDVVIVKDPRALWVYPLWERVAAAAGVELKSLTMLRHPAQVVRSTDSAYQTGRPDAVRRQRETTNVAAWVNTLLVTEQSTRGRVRTFVRYTDLVSDWRGALTVAMDHLGLDPGDLTAPHPIDDFLTPTLNRSGDGWDGLAVPAALRDLADRAWRAAGALATQPDDAAALATFDALRAEYDELHTLALGIAADTTEARLHEVRTRLRDLRGRLRARIAEQDEQIAALRQREVAPRPRRRRGVGR